MVALSSLPDLQATASGYAAVTSALAAVSGMASGSSVQVVATIESNPPITITMLLSSFLPALHTEQTRLVGVLTSLGVTSLS